MAILLDDWRRQSNDTADSMARLKTLTRTAILTLSLGLTHAAAAAPPYPVWWSPVLELGSLAEIDQRLARPIWPGDPEGMALYKDVDGVSTEVSAKTCNDLALWSAAGYEALGSDGWGRQQYALSLCRAVEMLRRARPAETSYLRDFVLDEAAVDRLPALVDLAPPCEWTCRQRVANKRRIPLARFEPVLQVAMEGSGESPEDGPGESPGRLKIRTIDWEAVVAIVARGDFNGDGLDDVLLLSSTGSISGTWEGADIYLLSRDSPGAVLTVVEEGRGLCRDIQCDATYDEPRVLRETNPNGGANGLVPARRRPITFGVIGGEVPFDFLEARQGPPYEVWWWPRMGVENLSEIAELLARNNWLTAEDTRLEIERGGQNVAALAKSCQAVFKLLQEGYRLAAESRSHVRVIRDCQALRLLGSAHPAKVSFLREFTLAAESPGLLSVLPRPWQAGRAGDEERVSILDERTLQIVSQADNVTLRFVAGGDFSGDDLDDTLLLWDDPGAAKSGLFILTRDGPAGRLRVLQVRDLEYQ